MDLKKEALSVVFEDAHVVHCPDCGKNVHEQEKYYGKDGIATHSMSYIVCRHCGGSWGGGSALTHPVHVKDLREQFSPFR